MLVPISFQVNLCEITGGLPTDHVRFINCRWFSHQTHLLRSKSVCDCSWRPCIIDLISDLLDLIEQCFCVQLTSSQIRMNTIWQCFLFGFCYFGAPHRHQYKKRNRLGMSDSLMNHHLHYFQWQVKFVWRTPKEAYNLDCLILTVKHRCGSVKIWAVIF